MVGRKRIVFVVSVLLFWLSNYIEADKPCFARPIKGKSVVCLCNETYCDTLTRDTPSHDRFVMYTSSKSGLRFNKTIGDLRPVKSAESLCPIALKIDPSVKYQTIEGFGGAVTDAAGINWKNLTDILQKHIIDSYFSEVGLEYNMIRTPIGGSDFSTRPYAYNELPANDTKLSNFTLTFEDIQYKVPMIKAALQAAKGSVHLVGTTWSPPLWMKTKQEYKPAGFLKTEYYQTYADYHLKFIDLYTKEGIPIWGITTTNEPSDCLVGLSPINCLGWTASSLGKWISDHLGPTIRNSSYKDTKILSGDDQRLTLAYWFNVMVLEHPKALEYIDGVAVHYYTDMLVPPVVFEQISLTHPDKFILSTEGCEGSLPWQKKVEFGSWQRAKNYATDIIEDLNYGVVGWIDWNLCLNAQGGPNWVRNFVDSPIIVFPEKKAFIKQPMFYVMGHFSKFIPRGSRRIEVTRKRHIFHRNHIYSVGFVTPNDTVVLVLYNNGPSALVNVRLGEKEADLTIGSDSIVTLEMPNQKY